MQMIPAIDIGGARVFLGDCRDVLRGLPDNSVDSIVTDPPYGLGFMGKEWDSFGKKGGISDEVRAKQQEKWGTKFAASAKSAKPSDGEMLAFQLWCTEWATECLRVLKPGGHILAFGGSRTWHRLAVAVEDAGFELRDSIAWIYGSGFPKSLDVSKAIDKGQGVNRDRQLQFTAWMRSTGLSQAECAKIVRDFAKNDESAKAMAQHYYSDKQQPAIPTADIFRTLRPYLPEVPEAIERLVAERTGIEWTAYKQREVIGQQRQGRLAVAPGQGEDRSAIDLDITLAKTPEAQKWQGWGTALKPAFEPVVVGRKPLVGTVAENVLQWGVGGLNIDGSRIGTDSTLRNSHAGTNGEGWGMGKSESVNGSTQGRWPANVILDEVTAGILDEQTGVTKSGKPSDFVAYGSGEDTGGNRVLGAGLSASVPNVAPYGDTGGASRFFYVAKASKRDRNEGLEGLQDSKVGSFNGNAIQAPGNKIGAKPDKDNLPGKNFHPTVKPTQLMRYLIKLVTPEGGVVLDPFTGSGSTGKAALLDRYGFIGAELTEEYLPIIEGRLRWASEQKGEDDDTLF
jgi:DNA modification methylase